MAEQKPAAALAPAATTALAGPLSETPRWSEPAAPPEAAMAADSKDDNRRVKKNSERRDSQAPPAS